MCRRGQVTSACSSCQFRPWQPRARTRTVGAPPLPGSTGGGRRGRLPTGPPTPFGNIGSRTKETQGEKRRRQGAGDACFLPAHHIGFLPLPSGL